MSDITFEVVSDDLRTKPRDTIRAEWVMAALDGKTVRVNIGQAKIGGYYKLFEKEGMKLRTKADGKEHTIIWAETKPELPALPNGKSK